MDIPDRLKGRASGKERFTFARAIPARARCDVWRVERTPERDPEPNLVWSDVSYIVREVFVGPNMV